MSVSDELPIITIALPVYNSEARIGKCVGKIRAADYPQEKLDIIIADGGSTDKTVEIAEKYGCRVINNERRLSEPGKGIGITHAKGSIVCFIDDDNYVDDPLFFRKMAKPFMEDERIVAAEPWEFTYRKDLKPLERYWAITGQNDPAMLFIGAYDRLCKLTGKWTSLKIKQEDKGDYIVFDAEYNNLPTIGANAFAAKRDAIAKTNYMDLLDMDKVAEMVLNGDNRFAKVKCGITHTYVDSLSGYWKKIKRKAHSFYGDVTYAGQSATEKTTRVYKYPNLIRGLLSFSLATATFFPIFFQSLSLFAKTKDFKASFIHIPVCYLTLFGYGLKALGILRK